MKKKLSILLCTVFVLAMPLTVFAEDVQTEADNLGATTSWIECFNPCSPTQTLEHKYKCSVNGIGITEKKMQMGCC